jgi:hypothetical protein
MKPKLLLNLILLAVLAALAAVAFFEPGKEQPKTVNLTDIDPGTLERFELHNKENLVFEKQQGEWRLAAPFSAPANDTRIRQLLNIAKAESRARYPLKPEELPKFELDKPKAVLMLGQTKLVFGGLEPIDMLRYVQIGDTLHLVADDFSHHLAAKATDYVDKKLLPEDANLKELVMPGLSAKRGDKGQWMLDPAGDNAAMAELANAWLSARAIEVSRHEKPAVGDVVRLVLESGSAVEFVIVQREPDLLLVRPDWKLEYMIPGEAGKRLLGLQKAVAENDKEQDEEDSEAPLEDAPDLGVDYDPGEEVDVEADGE